MSSTIEISTITDAITNANHFRQIIHNFWKDLTIILESGFRTKNTYSQPRESQIKSQSKRDGSINHKKHNDATDKVTENTKAYLSYNQTL